MRESYIEKNININYNFSRLVLIWLWVDDYGVCLAMEGMSECTFNMRIYAKIDNKRLLSILDIYTLIFYSVN